MFDIRYECLGGGELVFLSVDFEPRYSASAVAGE